MTDKQPSPTESVFVGERLLYLRCQEHPMIIATDKCHVCSKLICLACRRGTKMVWCPACIEEHYEEESKETQKRLIANVKALRSFVYLLILIVGLFLTALSILFAEKMWCAGVNPERECTGEVYAMGLPFCLFWATAIIADRAFHFFDERLERLESKQK
jgi:hypothetical protein